MTNLSAVLLNCTLKHGKEESSTETMLGEVESILRASKVRCEVIRMVDQNIAFGVDSDMGNGDGWPAIREKILASDILVIGTPIWLGNRGSVSQMVLERMDAFFAETNDKGQMPLYNKVGGVCVVGNEDGAQHVAAGVLYNLMQMGCTIPPNAEAYWVGVAGGREDYVDAGRNSKYTKQLVQYLAHNLVHLATMLKATPIPVEGNKAAA